MGHLAAYAVVVDTETLGVDVQWSENSNADDFSENRVADSPSGWLSYRFGYPAGTVWRVSGQE